MTIKQLYEHWITEKKVYVKQSTLSAYKLLATNHLLSYWKDIDPKTVNNGMMQDFVISLINKGLSNKSAKDISIVMKMILDHATERFGFTPIKFKLRYPTSTVEKSLEVYTSDEQKKILQYILDNPTSDRLAIAIALCSGMRIGEVCALKWSDVDIENRCMNISSTVQRIYTIDETFMNSKNKPRKTKVIFDTPKTASSNRSVPIAKILLQILKDYKRIMRSDYLWRLDAQRCWNHELCVRIMKF